jgi:hypothetical protein
MAGAVGCYLVLIFNPAGSAEDLFPKTVARLR